MQADINKRTQPKTKKKKGYCARTGKSSLERIHIEFTHHMVNETKAALKSISQKHRTQEPSLESYFPAGWRPARYCCMWLFISRCKTKFKGNCKDKFRVSPLCILSKSLWMPAQPFGLSATSPERNLSHHSVH